MNRSWHFQLHKHRRKFGFVPTDDEADLSSTTPALSTMDPTTLVTFLFRAPPEAHTVELFGSWDNFQQPYHMHHDRRRGRGFWSGCFTFTNIVFDGDKLDWSKPRSGGLKQGGTYWYFYRLNDDAEAYDDSQTYTTSCPLLPGQRLNIIEVPIEIQDLPSRCCSASGVSAEELARVCRHQTLDPAEKFAPLAPPPLSRVHGRCISDLAVNGRLENRPHSSKVRKIAPPDSPLEPRRGHEYQYDGLDADGFPETRSSPGTGGTWSSASPSFAQSSIVDVSARAFSGIASETGELSPVHEVRSRLSKGVTRVPYEEDVAPEFTIVDPFVGFDDEQAALDDDFDAFVQLPPSTPDHNGRPSTSRGGISFNEERSRRLKFGSFDHQISGDHGSPIAQPFPPPDERDFHDDTAPYDILSPSFSAATMSSAGLSTPFHLSAGCSRTASVHTSEKHGEATLDHVTAELRRLQSSYSDNITGSPPLYDQAHPSFSGYSLPPAVETAAVGHRRDLSKLSKTSLTTAEVGIVSHRLAPLASWSPPDSEHGGGGSSFADNVFSELSFFS